MKILYFSTVNWNWIKQRPHFISSSLSSKGHQVEFLSLNPLGKSKLKLKDTVTVKVRDKYVLPYSSKYKLIEFINSIYIKGFIDKQDYDCVIVTSPNHYKFIPSRYFKANKVIYECMDNMPYFYEGKRRQQMISDETELLALVNLVIVSADYLGQRLHSQYNYGLNKIKLVNNAIESTSFEKIKKEIDLSQPNLMYIGTIAHWIDWDVLLKFANKYQHYTLYLIGPVQNKPDSIPKNIKLVGPIEHVDIINYIYAGNIMILPFIVDELTRGVDPVKLYEYRAMRKRIVSSYWIELEKFKDNNIMFYNDFNSFEAAVQGLSKLNDETALDHPYIDNHNWNKRTATYEAYIIEYLKK